MLVTLEFETVWSRLHFMTLTISKHPFCTWLTIWEIYGWQQQQHENLVQHQQHTPTHVLQHLQQTKNHTPQTSPHVSRQLESSAMQNGIMVVVVCSFPCSELLLGTYIFLWAFLGFCCVHPHTCRIWVAKINATVCLGCHVWCLYAVYIAMNEDTADFYN
jgi:hypothetical protein